jgi:hypothetical protein
LIARAIKNCIKGVFGPRNFEQNSPIACGSQSLVERSPKLNLNDMVATWIDQ